MVTTRLAVVDTETTGATPEDQMCEIGIINLEHTTTKQGAHVYEKARWSSLIKPTCLMSIEGKAAHHITEEMLAEAWTTEEMIFKRGLPEFKRAVLVCHNLGFDLEMLRQSRVPEKLIPEKKICTWKCAQHLWPDAPRFSNQVLRYWLGIKVPQLLTLPPHRALPDALVTAGIVTTMLCTHSVDDLVRLTQTPVVLRKCYMGEHAGKDWKDVDSGFLKWILSKGRRRPNPKGGRDIGFEDDIIFTCEHYLSQRGVAFTSPQPRPMM